MSNRYKEKVPNEPIRLLSPPWYVVYRLVYLPKVNRAATVKSTLLQDKIVESDTSYSDETYETEDGTC
jgi:hypothetical protein